MLVCGVRDGVGCSTIPNPTFILGVRFDGMSVLKATVTYRSVVYVAGDSPPAEVVEAYRDTDVWETRPEPATSKDTRLESVDPIDQLRTEAESLGIKVDKRWSETTLTAKIAEAQK